MQPPYMASSLAGLLHPSVCGVATGVSQLLPACGLARASFDAFNLGLPNLSYLFCPLLPRFLVCGFVACVHPHVARTQEFQEVWHKEGRG